MHRKLGEGAQVLDVVLVLVRDDVVGLPVVGVDPNAIAPRRGVP